jgi:arginine:ornithine antiporter/lysine permease
LEPVVGKFGADFMNIGLLLSVLTSWLAWTMVTAQIPQAAAKNGTFPKEFAVESKTHAPVFSLYVTSFVMQLFMLLVYFSNNAWNTMLSITSVMVLPAYLASAMYLWKVCEDHEYPLNFYIKRSTALLCGIGGSLYAVWMIYAAGLSYLLMAIIFMALGIPVFMYARHQIAPDEKIFTKSEKCAVCLLILLSLFAIYAMMHHIV